MHLEPLEGRIFSRHGLFSFLYRIRVVLYLSVLIPVWILNRRSGMPLFARLVPHGSGFLSAKAIAVMSAFVFLLGVFLRMVGTAYIGKESVWGKSVRSRYLTEGPYRYLRHPIYQGSLLMMIALAPMCSAAGGVLLVVAGGGITLFLAIFEEMTVSEEHPSYKYDMEYIPRFLPRKGYLHFLITEGARSVFKKWPITVRSESFNIAFFTGFLAFATSFRTLYFWVSFTITFFGLWGGLLLHAGASQPVDPSRKER